MSLILIKKAFKTLIIAGPVVTAKKTRNALHRYFKKAKEKLKEKRTLHVQRMGDRCTIILPVEISRRELLSRVHLAVEAVARGHAVVIGDVKSIKKNLGKFSSGVYVIKDFYEIRAREILNAKAKGFMAVGWDEEGLIRISEKAYLTKVSKTTLSALDMVYAWGNSDAEILRRVCDDPAKVKVVGNPRMDLLNNTKKNLFAQEVKAIKNKVGRYILFNSSFSMYNSLLSQGEVEEKIRRVTKNDPASFTARVEMQRKFEADSIALFIECAKAILASTLVDTVVIRPHPVERKDFWLEAFKDFGNVIVSNEGNALPWLVGAEAVVHNSCTTGLEAFLLGQRVIVLGGDPPHWDFCLPNSVGERCMDVESFLSCLKRDDFNKRSSYALLSLAEHLSALDHRGSAKRILDSIQDDQRIKQPSKIKLQKKAIKAEPNLMCSIPPSQQVEAKPLSDYDIAKLEGLNKEAIEKILEQFGVKNVKLHAINESLLVLFNSRRRPEKNRRLLFSRPVGL